MEDAKLKMGKIEILAVVTRADGTVEDLGVISSNQNQETKSNQEEDN